MRWRLLGLALAAATAALIFWLASDATSSPGEVLVLRYAAVHDAGSATPPGGESGWHPIDLPSMRSAAPGERPRAAWYRLRFDLARKPAEFWAVLLPYFYGGGQAWLDGRVIAESPVNTSKLHVRWERPYLLLLPPDQVHAGMNELVVYAAPVDGESSLKFPAPYVGSLQALRPLFERRFFWVHTMPELTIGGCVVVALLMLFIWWRLPEEALYGLFGLATLLWGIRTLTFVTESLPPDRWQYWRLVYLASTGGFIVVLALFAIHLAGLRRRWAEYGLLAYWVLGPLWFLTHGLTGEEEVGKLWMAGMIPVALAMVVVSFLDAWRRRTLESLALPVALTVATLCGIHDYVIAWRPEALMRLAPQWAAERYFLLYQGANLLLVTMGALLSARFVRSVRALRDLNETLESRVADREQALAMNFQRVAELERENAASEERKLIMREIHDGLGSKLFTSLSRVERGAMDSSQMAASLRACIADMRLALDALAPDDADLLIALGDFMFRWQAELRVAGLECEWSVDTQHGALPFPPHATLQVLRVAQEALTNAAKHSGATRVTLSMLQLQDTLTLTVSDDGVGAQSLESSSGHGIRNMHARAQQLGGALTIGPSEGRGTRVVLVVPLVQG